ncbi:ATP-dependent helicase [Paenibacillus endoradicis]|uniref:ATP-dependent helicase n=1 Tax=Paenibacillus endoradicis TaxID=2972487 RepID=UPI002159A1E9|nr:ATP-dependent helicase [Paenibacillus endoradicis]MCR8659180.1 ATP-dependent helicase [Paenibacillus endoradicis]
MKCLEDLNLKQRTAVEFFERNSMVFAGPGTGKTRVITRRIAYLFESGRIPESKNVLAITFTNKAANEMKSRVQDFKVIHRQVRIGTFHNFCMWVLKAYGDKINLNRNFTFISLSQQSYLIRQVVNDSGIRMLPNDFKNRISAMKNASVDFSDYFDKTRNGVIGFHEAATEYQKRLYENNLIDYDDAILQTVTLFKNKPKVLELYQNAFPYVLVDEMQDTNQMQLELIRLIGANASHVMAVADDDQSIYGWRGAMSTVIGDYIRILEADTIILEENYRSPEIVLKLANRLIRNNNERTEKELVGRSNEPGDHIEAKQFDTWIEEAEWVTEKIKELNTEGLDYRQMIILYRKRHPSLKVFDELLIQNEIPFQHFGKNFSNKKTLLKDYIVTAMKLLSDHNNEVIMSSFLSDVSERFDLGTDFELYEAYKNSLESVTLENLSVIDTEDYIEKIIKEVAVYCLSVQKSISFVKIFDDLFEVLRLGSDLIKMDEGNRHEEKRHLDLIRERIAKSNASSISNLLAEIDLQDDSNHIDQLSNKVGVSTFHTAKGLEYKAVFIVALEDHFIPGRNTGAAKEEQEERRGLYVAITRSESKLYLTCSKKRENWNGIVENVKFSRFFKDMDTK